MPLEPVFEFEVFKTEYHCHMFVWCTQHFSPLTWEVHLTIDDITGDDGATFKFATKDQAVMFSLMDFSKFEPGSQAAITAGMHPTKS